MKERFTSRDNVRAYVRNTNLISMFKRRLLRTLDRLFIARLSCMSRRDELSEALSFDCVVVKKKLQITKQQSVLSERNNFLPAPASIIVPTNARTMIKKARSEKSIYMFAKGATKAIHHMNLNFF
jgi:hypothetical protein